MGDSSLRASDDDRERAVTALREHLLAGRLTLEEFGDRVRAALQARSGGELARIRADLPEVFVEADGSRRKPARFTMALLGQSTSGEFPAICATAVTARSSGGLKTAGR